MRTIRTKVYLFEELSKEAQENALKQLDEVNVSCNWWVSAYEDAEMIGLKIDGFDLYRREIDGRFIWDESEAANEILETHGNETETYKTAEKFLTAYNPILKTYMERDEPDATNQDLADDSELEADMYVEKEKFLKDLLFNYREMLQSDYDYLTSDEAIKETIIANEYEFTTDGKQI